MAASVDMQRHDRSLVLVYRNEPRGYMNADGARQLALAVEAAAVEPDIATIILAGGTEGVFVRHYDVSEIIAAGEALRSGRIGLEAMAGGPFASLVDAVAAAPKPVIAAINGTCMGGGFELALACDLRIVAPDVAQIGLPETRLGIFPGGGGTQRLPRLIGEARALEFILKGEVVDAPSAHALGLVHEIAASPIDRALELGALFASRPPEGLATAKALVRSALGHSITSGLIEERTSFGRVLQQSDGAMAAMASFCATGEDITRTA